MPLCSLTFVSSCVWSRYFRGWVLLALLTLSGGTDFWSSVFWATNFLPGTVTYLIGSLRLVAATAEPAMAALAMGNSLGEAFSMAILWSFLTIFLIIVPHFLGILDAEMIKICLLYFAFSDISLLGLSGGFLFRMDICLLQAFCIYFWQALCRNFRMKSLTCMKGMACLLTRVQGSAFKAMFWPITTTIMTSFLASGPKEKWTTQTTPRTHLNTCKPC